MPRKSVSAETATTLASIDELATSSIWQNTLARGDYRDAVKIFFNAFDRSNILNAGVNGDGDRVVREFFGALLANYYISQERRLAAANRARVKAFNAELPESILNARKAAFLARSIGDATVEVADKIVLDAALSRFSDPHGCRDWIDEHKGFGPLLSTYLFLEIDPHQRYASKVWRFFGLDPTFQWLTKSDLSRLFAGRKASDPITREQWGALCIAVNRPNWGERYWEEGWRVEDAARALSKPPFKQHRKVILHRMCDTLNRQKHVSDHYYAQLLQELWERATQANAQGFYRARAQYMLERGPRGPRWSPDWKAELEAGRLPKLIIQYRTYIKMSQVVLANFWSELHYRYTGQLPPLPWMITEGDPHARVIPDPLWTFDWRKCPKRKPPESVQWTQESS